MTTYYPQPGYSGPPITSQQNDAAVVAAAKKYGVNPNLALATMQQESGGNPYAVGNGSYGDFQLQQGGELGNLTPNQAFNPTTNADTALPVFAAIKKAHPNYNPGQIAAAAQRPANPTQYAASVNSILAKSGHKGTSSSGISTGSTSSSSAGIFSSFTNWFQGIFFDLVFIALGAAMILVGLKISFDIKMPAVPA